MSLTKWIYYLFKDNERFWVCFNFYVGCSLVPVVTGRYSNFIRKLVGDRLIFKYTLWCSMIVLETMEFKLKRCDLK